MARVDVKPTNMTATLGGTAIGANQVTDFGYDEDQEGEKVHTWANHPNGEDDGTRKFLAMDLTYILQVGTAPRRLSNTPAACVIENGAGGFYFSGNVLVKKVTGKVGAKPNDRMEITLNMETSDQSFVINNDSTP